MTSATDLFDFENSRPSAETLLDRLLVLEQEAKRERRIYGFDRLLGSWRLTFITGTKKAQKQAGNVLGKGRYLPGWVEIAIAYSATADNDPAAEWQRGTVLNSVKIGLLNVAVSGCIKFQAQKRLLAFDFTHVTVKLGGVKLYDGAMRGGDDAAAKFYETPISKLPFFSYFYVGERAIAARGKGGGVALWTKLSD